MFDRPILLYSNYCNHSKRFVESLSKNTDLFQAFIRINIDVDKEKGVRPPVFYQIQQAINYRISEVPTIIVDNAEYVLSGEEAFKWLDAFSKSKEPSIENELLTAFNPNEMGSFSDSYAQYGSNGLHDNSAQQSFKFLGSADEQIQTPLEDDTPVQNLQTKQQERENFTNMPSLQNKQMQMQGMQRPPPSMQGMQMQGMQMQGMSFGNNGGKASQKQKDMDARYQQLLLEREQLNTTRPRV